MTHHEDPVRVTLARAARALEPLRVLMLHGLAGSGSTWGQFSSAARPDCELWAADLPWRGAGFDRWAERPDAIGWVADAFASVPGGVHLVIAHSFSANVVLSLLSERVDVRAGLRGAVLVSPFYRPRAEDFEWATISYHLNNFHRILLEGIKVRANGRVRPDVQQDMALRVREQVGPYGWMRFFDTYLRTPQLSLDRIRIPCLIIGGARDLASFPADSTALAAALPHAEAHLVTDSGHFPMAERPAAFADLINRFLANIDAPALEHTE